MQSSSSRPAAPLGFHPTRFELSEDFDPRWHAARPDLALLANAVSMLMPHAEPYVVDVVRSAIPELSGTVAAEAATYARQEGQHHAQHRRFNDIVAASFPGVARLERAMRWTFDRLRGRSDRFGLAFAAGFESVAYGAARWVAERRHLLDGADEPARALFVWHLAEEVDHKGVAIDVYRAFTADESSARRRARYAAATATSLVVLGSFTMLHWLIMAGYTRRILLPTAWLRPFWWGLSFFFDLAPALLVSAFDDHHPDDLADPLWLTQWLDEFRAAERAPGLCPRPADALHSVHGG